MGVPINIHGEQNPVKQAGEPHRESPEQVQNSSGDKKNLTDEDNKFPPHAGKYEDHTLKGWCMTVEETGKDMPGCGESLA